MRGDWGMKLAEIRAYSDIGWRLAVVIDAQGDTARIGLQPGREASGALVAERKKGFIATADMTWAMRYAKDGTMRKAKSPADVLSPGDVVYVENKATASKQGDPGGAADGEAAGDGWLLRQAPQVEGGMVAMDPHTGRVLAMVGGFSYAGSQFNRATQAMRQPGSSFKPIVYAAALDNGYTPASVVMDAPITITVGNTVWQPQNYGGKSAGPSTLRLGIEKSRNLMTVRLAKDLGMNIVAEYAERFGVYDKLAPYLPMALGSGETTVMRMVSAYAVMANGGKQIKPSLIDRIQDRYGKTIFRHDERVCDNCNAQEWTGQAEPELVDNAEQVLDPMTAFQITSMMEGVVKRGTAYVIHDLGYPIAGKTGTTNEEKDAWFIGFTPDLVVGLYMGYDTPKPMGHGSTGGGLAAPVFK
jgi:penicillin-binding protein 1A